MSDDSFLTQIQDAEQTAEERIEKALQKKQSDLRQWKNDLTKQRKKSLETTQEASREDFKKTRVSARQKYEKAVEKGKEEATMLETEKKALIEPQLLEATEFLTQRL